METELKILLTRCAAYTDDDLLTSSDIDVLRQALAKAPYFTVAAILLLRYAGDGIGADERKALQRHVALTASCRRSVAFAQKGSEWINFYPPQADASSDTEDVIDIFLRTYGSCTPEEEAQLERMIFNPTPDYAELLARQEQAELPPENDGEDPRSQDALINAFIRAQHPAAHHPVPVPEPEALPDEQIPVSKPEHADDSLLSESLAKIFIKQHRYERAYEIISGLSLKFPKKSAYFADQLRFLQKLIINQRRLSELDASGAHEK